MEVQISGHQIEFCDCNEIVGGGPIACSMLIDGQEVKGARFDPSPLQYKSGILIPARKSNFFQNGYALCYIDFKTYSIRYVSKILPYIKLILINDSGNATIQSRVYNSDLEEIMIKL